MPILTEAHPAYNLSLQKVEDVILTLYLNGLRPVSLTAICAWLDVSQSHMKRHGFLSKDIQRKSPNIERAKGGLVPTLAFLGQYANGLRMETALRKDNP